jgi:coronin-7
VDEGLAMLRRQPSIKDRKRMFEAHIRKQEEPKIQDSKKSEPPKVNVVKETADEAKPLERQNSNIQTGTGNIQKQSSIEKEMDQKEMELEKSKTKSSSVLDNNIFRQNNKPKTEISPPEDSNVLRVASTAASKRPVSKMFRVSKFKHLKGETVKKNGFNNLKNLSKNVPAESNYFKANPDRVVVPLAGPGGKLAIFETKKPGRIPDGVTPVLINGTTVLDFDFDPFDNSRIAASCDDGTIRIWIIPEEGLTLPVNEPHLTLSAHNNKVQLVKWHPLAQDILISMAFDQSVKIWNLNDPAQPQMELEGHTEQIFSVEWSSCGQYVATVCKDGKIRLYEPRKSSSPFLEGGEIVAKKGARIAWVLDEQYLIVTGFSKQSERQVMLYRVSDLELIQNTVLDVSPAILIPHYDHDSSTLFLTSKGENTVTTFEVATDSPYLFPLSPYRPSGLHQALAFLPKNILDTKNVEFARAFRLTNATIEPLSFTVPRVNTAVFHDDIFPQTRVTWEPTLSAKDWFSGSKK